MWKLIVNINRNSKISFSNGPFKDAFIKGKYLPCNSRSKSTYCHQTDQVKRRGNGEIQGGVCQNIQLEKGMI